MSTAASLAARHEMSRRGLNAAYVRIIADLATRGCNAVVLGCTEIPLQITSDVSPLPTLDSTRLLVFAAAEVAMGLRSAPSWRGGPV